MNTRSATQRVAASLRGRLQGALRRQREDHPLRGLPVQPPPGRGPRERMVPLINNAGATLRWFVEDVWAQFGDDHARPGVPLLPSERRNADGSAARVGDEALRAP